MAQLARLTPVPLREAWSDEAGDFTPWLATEENIALLGETIGLELEVEAQERSVGPFRADILCRETLSGNWVLIENQLEDTDHEHLGQLLTYAAGLRAVTIVWIAKQFTDEHRAALDWLNGITDASVNFFGLEIELWRIGDSPIAPKFSVVSKPKEGVGPTPPLPEGQRLYLDYWIAFRDVLVKRAGPVGPTKPLPDHWMGFSIGRSGFGLRAYASTPKRFVTVALNMSGPDAKPHFHLLEQDKADVEAAVGVQLEWRELPDKDRSQIRLQRQDTDLNLRGQWPEQHAWLAEKLEAFHRVFAPRVKELHAADYEREDVGDLETEMAAEPVERAGEGDA